MQNLFGVCTALLCLATLSTVSAAAQGGDAVIDGAVKPAEIRDISGGPFFETCPTGEAIRVINPNGTVLCETVGGGGTATDLDCTSCVAPGELDGDVDARYINVAGDLMTGELSFGLGDGISAFPGGLSITSDESLDLNSHGVDVNAGTGDFDVTAGGLSITSDESLDLSSHGVDVNAGTGDFDVTAVTVNIESQGVFIGTLGGGVRVDGTLVHSSDRNLKSLLREVDGSQILGELADLPLYVWRWQDRPDAPVHIGPTAQDFAEAFDTGDDDRYIASLDAQGVALAALQELHRRLGDKDRELARLRQQQERLEAQLEELRVLVIKGPFSNRAR